jgi:hypothetical protein
LPKVVKIFIQLTGSEFEYSPVSCEENQSREVIREAEHWQAERRAYFREVHPISYIQETVL